MNEEIIFLPYQEDFLENLIEDNKKQLEIIKSKSREKGFISNEFLAPKRIISTMFKICDDFNQPVGVKLLSVDLLNEYIPRMVHQTRSIFKELAQQDPDQYDWPETEQIIKRQLMLRMATCVLLASKLLGVNNEPILNSNMYNYLKKAGYKQTLSNLMKSEIRILQQQLPFRLMKPNLIDYLEVILSILNTKLSRSSNLNENDNGINHIGKGIQQIELQNGIFNDSTMLMVNGIEFKENGIHNGIHNGIEEAKQFKYELILELSFELAQYFYLEKIDLVKKVVTLSLSKIKENLKQKNQIKTPKAKRQKVNHNIKEFNFVSHEEIKEVNDNINLLVNDKLTCACAIILASSLTIDMSGHEKIVSELKKITKIDINQAVDLAHHLLHSLFN